jgi:hypothetical protein
MTMSVRTNISTLRYDFPSWMRDLTPKEKVQRIKENVREAVEDVINPTDSQDSQAGVNGVNKLKIGTFCSGVCGVMRMFEPVWNLFSPKPSTSKTRGFKAVAEQTFVSDCGEDQIEWNKLDPTKQHIKVFGDICDLLDGSAHCFKLDKETKVEPPDMYIGSSVCKEGSPLTQERAALNMDLKIALEHARNSIRAGKVPDFCGMKFDSTAVTTAAALTYVVKWKIKLCILENLFGILRADSPNGQLIRDFLWGFGYIAPCLDIQSSECAVPQRRRRGYLVVAFYAVGIDFGELMRLEKNLRRNMQFSVGELIVTHDGNLKTWVADVNDEFELSAKTGRAFRSDCGKKRVNGTVVDDAAGWPEEMIKRFKDKNRTFKMPRAPTPEKRKRDPHFCSLGQYPQAKVLLQELDYPRGKSIKHERCYDLSHSLERLLEPKAICPTLKKTSLIWVEETREVLQHQHHWAAQGLYLKDFPQHTDNKKFTDTKLKAFAGDAKTGTALQKAFTVVLIHVKIARSITGPNQFSKADLEDDSESEPDSLPSRKRSRVAASV